ncbi:MAG: hypothetical protein ACR5KW_00115 [Wolbachia sp.]
MNGLRHASGTLPNIETPINVNVVVFLAAAVSSVLIDYGIGMFYEKISEEK